MNITHNVIGAALFIVLAGCENNVIVSDTQFLSREVVEVLPANGRILSYSTKAKETDTSFADVKSLRNGRYLVTPSDDAKEGAMIVTTYLLEPPNYLVEFRLLDGDSNPYNYFPAKITLSGSSDLKEMSVYAVDYQDLAQALKIPHATEFKSENEFDGFEVDGKGNDILKLSNAAVEMDAEPIFVIFDLDDKVQQLEAKVLIAERRANKAEKAADAAVLRAKKQSEKLALVDRESSVPSKKKKVTKPAHGGWVFSDSSSGGKTRRNLSLLERGSNSSPNIILRVACTSEGIGIEVVWGVAMQNLYPNESVPTATRVLAQFGHSAVWDMGWQPSANGTVTRAPKLQLDVASSIDSAIFSLLGMDSISKKNKAMFNWTPSQFFNRLATQAHSTPGTRHLQLGAKNSHNQLLTPIFDLTGFNEIANQKFKGVCIH